MSKRSKEWRRRRAMKVWRKSGGACWYCGAPLSAQEMTLDHVQAKARGGDGRESNLVAACRRCNQAKGHRDAATLGVEFWREAAQ